MLVNGHSSRNSWLPLFYHSVTMTEERQASIQSIHTAEKNELGKKLTHK